MPAGWYADIEDMKQLADRLDKAKDARGAEVVRRLVTELVKFRSGELPSEIEASAKTEEHREG